MQEKQRVDETIEAIKRIVDADKSYHFEAYEFIHAAVVHVCAQNSDNRARHVSARELLEGISLYAFEQFSGLAEHVLRNWGINSAVDVGVIVFKLAEKNVLSVSENDSPEDFNIDFDLFMLPRTVTEPAPVRPRSTMIID